MRAANERTPPELELALARFIDDFEDIIREHVQRAVKAKLGSRTRGRPRGVKSAVKREVKSESKREAKPESKREVKPESKRAPRAEAAAESKRGGKGAAKRGRAAKKTGTRAKTGRNPAQLSLF